MTRQSRRSVLAFAALAAALLFGISSVASAQGAPGFHIGLSGGADFPVEDQSDAFETGWNGTLILAWNFGESPFGIRLDGSYHELKIKDELLVSFTEGKTRILDGTFDFVIGPHIGPYVQPYILGGVGAYDMRFRGQEIEVDDIFSDSTTRFGWNAGTGVAFRVGDTTSTHVFFEGRYTSISTDGDRFTDTIHTGGNRFTMVVVNTGIIF
jgi:opacity protein-like surface antigen